MIVFSSLITLLGMVLIWSWFGTRRRMKRFGVWDQNKLGAYMALTAYIILLLIGVYLY